MTELYSSIVIGLVVALATLTYALRNSFETFIDWDSPMRLSQFRLLLCDRMCRCTDACAYMNYSDRGLHCKLTQRDQTDHSLHLEQRSGFMKTEHPARPTSGDAPTESCRDRVSMASPRCPDLVTDGATALINNLTTVGRQGSIQFANFTWSPRQEGWTSAACSVYSQCVATMSGMRGSCQLDSDCFDAQSECRAGQCWCKPGLSHDPDSRACVGQCPGQYGSTFQEVIEYIYPVHKTDHFTPVDTDDIQLCKDTCLEYSQQECRRADYIVRINTWVTNNYYCRLTFFPNPRLIKAPIKSTIESTSLIRDCKSVIN